MGWREIDSDDDDELEVKELKEGCSDFVLKWQLTLAKSRTDLKFDSNNTVVLSKPQQIPDVTMWEKEALKVLSIILNRNLSMNEQDMKV